MAEEDPTLQQFVQVPEPLVLWLQHLREATFPAIRPDSNITRNKKE